MSGVTLRRLARLRSNRVALAGAVFLGVVAMLGVFAPFVAPGDENQAARFQDVLLGPSGDYFLGTDHVGRDILSRLLFGARYALIAGLEAVTVAVVIGVPLGLVIGYRRGRLDQIVMRIVESVVSIPAIVMAMAIIAGLGPGLTTAMLAIGLVFSMMVTRLTRAEVLAAREELYVDGAMASGASSSRVMWRHILPNVAPALIVQVTLMFAQAVLAEAALSFLGIGAASTEASWGRMLRDAQLSLDRTIWPAIPPGIMIFLTVIAFNVLGDGLRDTFGRETRGRRLGGGAVEAAVPAPGATLRAVDDAALLSVTGLSVAFPHPSTDGAMTVVDQVSFDIAPGETLALVGESGSGKSLTALSLIGLIPEPGSAHADSITFGGRELVGADPATMRRIRGAEIGVVFQEPHAALNPSATVGYQVAEPLRFHGGLTRTAARQRVVELFDEVGIPDPETRLDAYPHQFSGGMAQRVMLAMALACEPQLLIADEATTALDVTVQAQVLDLIRDLSQRRSMAVLMITHDLGVVADIADTMAVMYAGQLVESGPVADVLARPQHPYTEGLIAAIPRNVARSGDLPTIDGLVPPPWEWPDHCHFADRCPYATDRCRQGPVRLRVTGTRANRCERDGELELVGVEGPQRAAAEAGTP